MSTAVTKEIAACRICGNPGLEVVLDLGTQFLTGVFPKSPSENVLEGPLQLVKCVEGGPHHCGLLQLKHSYALDQMYGDNYGYRSGLNASMVKHLGRIVDGNMERTRPKSGDVFVDVGSNDATLLKSYPKDRYRLIGIDPTARKFKEFYSDDIEVIPDFFTASALLSVLGSERVKVLTSIAMFYDLESPLDFVRDVAAVLADDGIWVFEQSYMPAMIERTSYDTVCHEHLEFYALKQIKWMLDRADLKIIELMFTETNGGSILVTAAKNGSPFAECKEQTAEILDKEKAAGYGTLKPFKKFASDVEKHANDLKELLIELQKKNKKVLGYGASTKGNVVLQYAGITPQVLPGIVEVNEEKFGAYTPGSHIPILSEKDADAINPDYYLVLPWHFRESIMQRETAFLKRGGKFIFPLPSIQIVDIP